ncbi:MAG: 50S ribosomal protein L11 methyltransferase [Alphaproteobacteria bacterium]|nr:50S ribosomal protein L11 methyltransferase [Alphaproteobacteria bacterium]
MPLWRIALQVEGADAATALADMLDDIAGAVSAFETREGSPAEWLVETYASTPLVDAALDLRLTLAATAAGGRILDLIEMPVAERDWLADNRRAFPPQRIGRFFVRGSHWHGVVPPGAVAIEIDAATAFGTGEHPSTRGCLVAFEQMVRRCPPRRVRDIGTGSGILGIAAAKRLRRRVAATDIDPAAVAVARHHARRNGVGRLVRCRCAAGAGRGRGYDLVLANILARPLMLMARDIARTVTPGGRVVLSGLLSRQEAGVLAAYRLQRLTLDSRIVIDGWSVLVLRKGKRPVPGGTGRSVPIDAAAQSGGNHGNH